MATKGISLFKKFCHERPDLMGSFIIAAIGVAGVPIYFYKYDEDKGIQHRYEYTVIRAEDANPVCVEKGVYN